MARKSYDHLFPEMVAMYQLVPSMDDVATHFGCTRKVVRRALDTAGKAPRSRREAKRKRWSPHKVVYEGQPFESVASLARHLGEAGQTLAVRLSRRKAPMDALTAEHVRPGRAPDIPSAVAKEYVFEDRVFTSIIEACREYRQTRSAVEHRLRRGWTQRQAFELDPAPSRTRNKAKQTELVDGKLLPKTEVGCYKLYEITNRLNGKVYIGITVVPLMVRLSQHLRLAKAPDRNSKLYNAIIKHGEDAFEIRLLRDDAENFLQLQQQEIGEIEARDARNVGYNMAYGGSLGTPKSIKVGNLVYPSRGSAAEAFGIAPSTFNLRLTRYGWTPEQAAEIEPRPGGYSHRRLVVGGKPYTSKAKAAEAIGISMGIVLGRLSRKATVDQAYGLQPLPDHFRRVGEVQVGDEVFKNMKEAAHARGLTPATVYLRLGRGATVRQALGYDPMPAKPRRRAAPKPALRSGTPDLFA